MTKQKAIAQLENLKEHCNEMSKSNILWESDVIALDIAIKELKKDTVLRETEVVTCKDCKYYRGKGEKHSYCSKRVNVDSITDRYREPDFYCKDAEKKRRG